LTKCVRCTRLCVQRTRKGSVWVGELAIVADGNEAFLFRDECFKRPLFPTIPSSRQGDARGDVAPIPTTPPRMPACAYDDHYVRRGTDWVNARTISGDVSAAEYSALAEAYMAGRLEIRPVERRQLFIGGVPVGDAFE